MTHVKWLIAKDSESEAWEYASKAREEGGFDYCEVEPVGLVEDLLRNIERREKLKRDLRFDGILPSEVDDILEKARRKGKRMIFLVDCHY
jgi:hypothetical protein